MKLLAKLMFSESVERYSKIAVKYIEETCSQLKGAEKKQKAVNFIVKRLSIPRFLRKIPFIYSFLYRNLDKIQAFAAVILSDEIDLFIESHVKELKNESV